MKILLQGAGVFLIFIGFFLFVTRFHPLGTIPLVPPSFSLEPLTASAVLAASTTVPTFNGSGILFIDQASNTPYLLYETQANRAAIKELIFSGTNDCAVLAGGYSCVSEAGENTGIGPTHSNITPGDGVTITGASESQALRVNAIAQSGIPDGIQEFTLSPGQTQTIGTITVTPGEPLQGASCTLGEGCTSSDQVRVPVTIETSSPHATELTEGAVYAVGNSIFVLISAVQQNGIWMYTIARANN